MIEIKRYIIDATDKFKITQLSFETEPFLWLDFKSSKQQNV